MRALRAGRRDRARRQSLRATRKIATHAVRGVAGLSQPARRERRGDPFRACSTRSRSRPRAIPVFANTTALPYPADPAPARALLAGQLARPVEFVAQIEAMYRMGARTFLEVGPDAKLTALVRVDPRGTRASALAVDASRGGSGNVLIWPARSHPWPRLGMLSISTRWDQGDHSRGDDARKPGLP